MPESLEESLTELAEGLYNFTKVKAMSISNIKETIRSWLFANRMVQKVEGHYG